MRVAVYHSNRDVRIEERPTPAIGPDEILMRVEASGVCGSDVMEWYRLPKAPIVLGHEVAGTVAQAGDGVTRFRHRRPHRRHPPRALHGLPLLPHRPARGLRDAANDLLRPRRLRRVRAPAGGQRANAARSSYPTA